jgi:gentisate 1,2-dioxygenase
MTATSGPIVITASDQPDQPQRTPELEALYSSFESELVVPLWTEIGELMPAHPRSRAMPHLWKWSKLLPMAAQAGRLVPVGRGGERRAIALANPGLGGRPFATPTLWAAIPYLNPGEDAPVHRHIQHAFRFVVEGEGGWTVVNSDPVSMRRGDFLPRGARTGTVTTTSARAPWRGSTGLNRSGFDAASFCEKDWRSCPSITRWSSVSVR